jgi:hypothetical protein
MINKVKFDHIIHNADNQQDRPIGLSIRRRDQTSRDVLWSVFERVTQSNARHQALDTLTFHMTSVKMHVGFGKRVEKTKGRPLSVMTHLKRSIVEVNTEENCLAHALVMAMVRVTNVPDYQAYEKGRKKILSKARELLQAAFVDLSRGGGIPELQAFQHHISEYRIVVCSSLRCDSIMFDGQVATPQRINLSYDSDGDHGQRIVCPACNKVCRRGAQHRCNASCDDNFWHSSLHPGQR